MSRFVQNGGPFIQSLLHLDGKDIDDLWYRLSNKPDTLLLGENHYSTWYNIIMESDDLELFPVMIRFLQPVIRTKDFLPISTKIKMVFAECMEKGVPIDQRLIRVFRMICWKFWTVYSILKFPVVNCERVNSYCLMLILGSTNPFAVDSKRGYFSSCVIHGEFHPSVFEFYCGHSAEELRKFVDDWDLLLRCDRLAAITLHRKMNFEFFGQHRDIESQEAYRYYMERYFPTILLLYSTKFPLPRELRKMVGKALLS